MCRISEILHDTLSEDEVVQLEQLFNGNLAMPFDAGVMTSLIDLKLVIDRGPSATPTHQLTMLGQNVLHASAWATAKKPDSQDQLLAG